MTLNQIISRLRTISLAHKQVRKFFFGNVNDFFTEKTSQYPAICIQDNGANIGVTSKERMINFTVFILDRVHVAGDQKMNELDVQSDCLAIGEDLIATIDYSGYHDWKIGSSTITANLVAEYDNDLIAGAALELSISTIYEKDVCAIPTNPFDLPDQPSEDMKLVYNYQYTADGTEGAELEIPALAGKKILFITREFAPLYLKTNPDSGEYYDWDNSVITLGSITNPEEKFLILYRNY